MIAQERTKGPTASTFTGQLIKGRCDTKELIEDQCHFGCRSQKKEINNNNMIYCIIMEEFTSQNQRISMNRINLTISTIDINPKAYRFRKDVT